MWKKYQIRYSIKYVTSQPSFLLFINKERVDMTRSSMSS